jgi:hypothetical protein
MTPVVKCWDYEPLDKDEVQALKAMHRGDATAYQQRLVLKVVINKFARLSQPAFVPGDPHQGAFLSGRQFVGLLITDTLNRPLGQLVYPDDETVIETQESKR